MSTPGSYDPKLVEPEIYALWERGDGQRSYFHAEPPPAGDTARKPFTIVIPPPNVTGALHLGHALNNTLQDILIRRKRMQGFSACWLPGTDHAGIATQAVVEKRLREEQGWKRDSASPEHRTFLVEKIWAWKEDYNARILNQLRKMGCSCDWERTRFTLDDMCAKAVYETFFRFFKDGLIYRGLRLVNWDAQLQTAVADDEIEHKTVKTNLWHIRYPIAPTNANAGSGPGALTTPPSHALTPEEVSAAVSRATAPSARLGHDYLIVATTRPETMLADTAVAVHPEDERYRPLIGRRVLLPLMNRPIPIIADGMLVKKEFGTGCVKVTPGHDPNDYACWQRHEGEADEFGIIDLLTPDGKINNAGRGQAFDYAGMKKEDARKQIVADLETLGLLEKIEPYETEVGHSDRSKTPIEPLRSEQWFVKMDKLAETAMEAVRDGRVRFFPERYAKTYLDWLGEKRDWCISRQLWWGHRIPVWTFLPGASFVDPTASLIHLQQEMEAGRLAIIPIQDNRKLMSFEKVFGPERAKEILLGYGWSGDINIITPGLCPCSDYLTEFARDIAPKFHLVQDPDVLDTWFSSALWPHSTFGWPGDDDAATSGLRDLDYFYPTSVLSTAREIITLWVARMVMTGLYNVGRVPFQHVYIHAVIQDGQGRRMSKSAGNGVDPLDIIDAYGADALRFTLAQLATETQDIRIPVKPATLPDGRTVNTSERFEYGRNFVTKVWQAATGFILPNLTARSDEAGAADTTRNMHATADLRPLAAADLALEDRWILSRLAAAIAEIDRSLERYEFSNYVNTIYAFFWSDFCDWYVELVKPRLFDERPAGADKGASQSSAPRGSVPPTPTAATGSADVARRVLAWVLDQSLRLLHPAIPFVTEAIWSKLNAAAPIRGITTLLALDDAEGTAAGPSASKSQNAMPGIDRALIAAAWPDASAWPREPQIETQVAELQEVIRTLRDVRMRINGLRSQSKQSALRTLPRAVIRCDASTAMRLNERMAVLLRLGQCERIEIGADVAKPPESASKVLTGLEVYVPLSGLADLEVERQRLRKERDELAAHIGRTEGKLSNEGFVAKAPAAVIEADRARLAESRQRLAAIEANLAEIGD